MPQCQSVCSWILDFSARALAGGKNQQRVFGPQGSQYLVFNVSKTKEMFIDFRKVKSPSPSLMINGAGVELVDSFKLLGFHISDDLL